MSEHEKTQPERSSEVATPDELDDQALTTVAGGAQSAAPQPASLKAGASEVLMETVNTVSEFRGKK